MFTGNPGHLRKFDYTGFYRYSLAFCTDSRRNLFTTQAAVDLVLLQIDRSANEEGFAIVAYCFMPDHLHLLVEARAESSDCRAFIKRAKQYSGFYFSKEFKDRLWQRYGFERVLRDDEATLVVARYILENPVRARLVQIVEDYPFLGSRTHPLPAILTAVADDCRSRSG